MINRVALATALVASALCPFARAREPSRDPLHGAIGHWINGNRNAALLVIQQSVLEPESEPGTVRGKNGALRNLGARLHYDQYLRLRRPDSDAGKREIRRAEIFAAAAVWEDPFDIHYWRDYVRFAAEQRVAHAPRYRPITYEQALVELADELRQAHLHYPDLRKGFVLTQAPEMRDVGRAVVRAMQGDLLDAQRILESRLSEGNRRARCTAAVILVELQMEIDHFAAAAERVNEFVPRCTDAPRVRLAARKELFDAATSAPSRGQDQTLVRSLSEDLDVYSPKDDPLDIADRILREPFRSEHWDDLRGVAGYDNKKLAMYDSLIERVLERYEAPPLVVKRARAFRLLQLGKFEKARAEFDLFLEDNPESEDAEVLLASVLIDTDDTLDQHEESRRRLSRAREIAPHLSACIDGRAIRPCLDRREECTLCAILCSDADSDLVYKLWKRGVSLRPTAAFQEGRCRRELATRVDLNRDLMDQIEPRVMARIGTLEASVERRFAAQDERIDFIVTVKLQAMEKSMLVQGEELKAAMQREDERLRRDFNREIEQNAANDEMVKAIASEARTNAAEGMRLLHGYSADLVVLKALHPHLPALQTMNWERLQAQLNQLAAAVGQLEKPELIRYAEGAMDPNAPADKRLNALISLVDYIFSEGVDVIAFPGRGAVRLLKYIPLVKALSDLEIGLFRSGS